MIEAPISKVWALIRPGTFEWWNLIESSTADPNSAVGATSVQTYRDGSKLTVKLLEMSVSIPQPFHAHLACAESGEQTRCAQLGPTNLRVRLTGSGSLSHLGNRRVGECHCMASILPIWLSTQGLTSFTVFE